MSPLDDELRAALRGRATVLAPSPDPLAGIERRARRIQRSRVGAAIAGSVLAVAAVAAVVPALQSSSAQPDVPRVAATPAPVVEQTSYALDPDDPWAYRGTPEEQLGTGTLGTIEREYTLRHPNALVTVTPLWGQVWEPSGQAEVVLLTTVDGQPRWAVARGGEAGPEFPVDEVLEPGTRTLAAVLPGDEVARLLVVAAPTVSAIEYAADKASEYRALELLARGVGVGPLDMPGGRGVYRVLDVDGQEIDFAETPSPPAAPAPVTGDAALALDPDAPWELRGQTAALAEAALVAIGADFAARRGGDPEDVEVVPLYVQSEDGAGLEVAYLVRSGGGPWFWGVSGEYRGLDGTEAPTWSWYAERELEPGTAALVTVLPRGDLDPLVLVVAAPSTGGAVLTREGSEYLPMQDAAPGVFTMRVPEPVEGSRYRVLDGDGDLDAPVAEGEVPPYQNAG